MTPDIDGQVLNPKATVHITSGSAGNRVGTQQSLFQHSMPSLRCSSLIAVLFMLLLNSSSSLFVCLLHLLTSALLHAFTACNTLFIHFHACASIRKRDSSSTPLLLLTSHVRWVACLNRRSNWLGLLSRSLSTALSARPNTATRVSSCTTARISSSLK